MNTYFWTPEEDAIVQANYGKVPISQFAPLLPGRSADAIQLHARRRLGLSADHLEMSALVDHSRYERNANFFAEVRPLASYWAGFIAADGCIDSPKNGISISLTATDAPHLEQLRADLGFTRPLVYRIPKSRGGPQVNLTVCAAYTLMSDLQRNYCIGPRKSLTLVAPRHLDHVNTLAYIVGYIDGDGCIRHIPASGRDLTSYLKVKILGTEDLLAWIASVFDTISPPGSRYPKPHPTPYKIWVYSVAGQRARALMSYLLDAVDVPRMARKWDTVRHFQATVSL